MKFSASKPAKQIGVAVLAWLTTLAFAAAQVPNSPIGTGMPGSPPPAAQQPAQPQPTIVRLPVLQDNGSGELVVQPNVGIGSRWSNALSGGASSPPPAPTGFGAGSVLTQPLRNLGLQTQFFASSQDRELPPPPPPAGISPPNFDLPPGESLPPPGPLPQPSYPETIDNPVYGEPVMMDTLVPDYFDEMHDHFVPFLAEILLGPARLGYNEPGIGRERLVYAPFVIDTTQPLNNFRIRYDSIYNLTLPDRAEYFWSGAGLKGPAPERSVDYQEFRFMQELATENFSTAIDVPIRILNPEINGNNAGVGDISLTTKLVLLNGNEWQMTQITRTTFNNGNAKKGLGTGHVSMEPGMLFRYKWNDLTYVHAEIELNFPIAGDPVFAAPVLKYGIGMSHLYYDSDEFAVIQTLEFVNIWFLDGLKTLPPAGPVPPNAFPAQVDIDGEGAFNLVHGVRLVCDTGGDLGLVEFGFAGGVGIGSNGWFDAQLAVDVRFSW